MKKRKSKAEARVTPAPAAPRTRLYAVWAAAAAFLAGLFAYLPALRGEFVFDDQYLPFNYQEFTSAPLRVWLIGVRPLLMFSFWLNHTLSGLDPMPYHLTNLFLHLAATLFVWLCIRKILEKARLPGGRGPGWLAAFAAGLFLLHPIQTESVAYVASRSEVLSVMLFYAAFTVFLYRRRDRIGWLEALAVAVLFGAAVSTKEHAAVLPLLLLLTDYFWNPGFSFRGALRNWRLYGLLAAGGAAAAWWIVRVLRASDTAGLSLREANWYEYFLTQGRVIWLYLRLFLFPFGLNIDHDVPFSRHPFDHGAILGLAGLAALGAAAIVWRRRYPLASYGVLAFFLLLAPTSSFVPILDPAAERRMYLPFFGLALVVADFVRRRRAGRQTLAAACAAVLVLLFGLTYARNRVWASATALWEDSVAKSPNKLRPRFQLAYAYFAQGRCAESLKHFEAAANAPGEKQYTLYLDWALAYDCAGDRTKAIEKIRQAEQVSRNAHVYAIMGMLYGKQARLREAAAALDTAVELDPNFGPAYFYRGVVHAANRDFERAAADYRRALALNPNDENARSGLASIQAQLGKR